MQAEAPARSDTPARAFRRTAETLAWSLIALWALSSLWYPFGWDQGIIAWVGATILDGGMPYRDAFDLKGPLAYYVFALAQAVFGHNLWGIRVLDLVGLAASGGLLFAVVRPWTDGATARWAAALWVVWFAGLTFWHTAQPDGFAAMFLALGLLPLAAADRPSAGRSALAGAMIGSAVAIKPHYAALLVVPAVHAWLASGRHARRAVGMTFVAAAAALVVPALMVAWFAYRDALDSLIEVHVRYNAAAYSSGATLALGSRLRGLVEYVRAGELFVVLLPAAVYGALRLRRDRPVAAWTLVSWAAVALAGVVLQNKFFDYQWIPMFPPVSILAVLGLRAGILGTATGPSRPPVVAGREERVLLGHVLAGVIFVHAAVHPAFEVVNWASHVAGARDRVSYYDTFGVPGDDLRMVEHIRATSRPGDRLVVLGWNLEVLYMTGLPTVSRLAFSLPVWMGEGTELQAAYRAELMNDLHAAAPELVVVAEQAEPLIGRPVSLDDFEEFRKFLGDRYERDVAFGPLALYRLRNRGRTP